MNAQVEICSSGKARIDFKRILQTRKIRHGILLESKIRLSGLESDGSNQISHNGLIEIGLSNYLLSNFKRGYETTGNGCFFLI